MARRRDHGNSRRAGAPTQRQLRVGEELRHALAQLLRPGELRDPALHDASITVTEVRVSPDLKNATAFVMPLAGAHNDEIMAGLTPTEVRLMTEFVAGLPARGITVIWVEHVLHAIMRTATRIVVLNRGELIAAGTPQEVARDPAVVKAYFGEEMNLA